MLKNKFLLYPVVLMIVLFCIDKVLLLDSIKKYFNLDKNNKIAILTRGNRTIGIINENLKTPNKVSLTTDLDTSLNIWSGIFSNLLHFSLDNSFKFIEVVEEFTSYDRFTKQNRTRIIQLKSKVIQLFSSEVLDKDSVIKTYREIAEIIAPNSVNEESLDLLKGVLSSKNQIESYKPADEKEINIMTLHKSKGLEFDAVIHLDLYEWVMPFGAKNDQKINNPREWIQDLNLHYVGITRAKKACLLISSTQRTNNAGDIRRGLDSEFLWKDKIENLRFKKAD
jgi:DNA helicase-2/ATP-dependent DNA helicase PcrA